MIWQDIVVAIANVLFGYSLAYQVYKGFKEKKGALSLQSSLLTTIGLYSVAVVYASLSLYISTLITIFNGTMWLLLFMQKLIYK
jgi:hypothetical protein